jgi:hypothetical protein
VSIQENEILNMDAISKSSPAPRVPALVLLADKITNRLKPGLFEEAKKIASKIEYEKEGSDSIEDMTRNLRVGIPPRRPRSPIDILNAVWFVFLEKQKDVGGLEDRNKLTALMTNLCLKSLEIYEYNRIK